MSVCGYHMSRWVKKFDLHQTTLSNHHQYFYSPLTRVFLGRKDSEYRIGFVVKISFGKPHTEDL